MVDVTLKPRPFLITKPGIAPIWTWPRQVNFLMSDVEIPTEAPTGFDALKGMGTQAEAPVHERKVDAQGRSYATGKRLDQFVNGSRQDFREARRVVNRLDKADKIAAQARQWLDKLD